jgi:4-diphosphocytidyl-2-C-methyl-D-erythritol kinase
MILFPSSKLNIGLQITAKRSDGFHNLKTVFYPFPLNDVLEIIEEKDQKSGTCIFTSTGLPIPGTGENLCEKAYMLLHEQFKLPAVRIYLHKIIPMGAGLGGGSSDATSTLKLLNQLFKLGLTNDALKEKALMLGSDCPLFVEECPQYAEGRGELLRAIDLNLKGKHLLLVYPRIHISTAEAFANVLPREQASCEVWIEKDLSTWKKKMVNDFEHSVFPNHPELKNIKEKLYSIGADYAAMSGSGSTLFGVFSEAIPKTDWPSDYFVWQTQL